MNNPQKNIELLRKHLKQEEISAILIRSTDQYLNEYVPKYASIRYLFSGFDGSMGDVIITQDSAHLFVDGRYGLQAKNQTQDFVIHVCLTQGIEESWLFALSTILNPKDRLAFDPATVDLNLYGKIFNQTTKLNVALLPKAQKIFADILGPLTGDKSDYKVWEVSNEYCGLSVKEKIQRVQKKLTDENIDGLLLTKLDDIAWICNLRSNYFPYQTTLPAIAAATKSQVLLGLFHMPKESFKHADEIKMVSGAEFFKELKNISKGVLGVDGKDTTKQHEMGLNDHGIKVQETKNFISTMKAIKNEKELLHLRSAFKKADEVVHKTIRFIQEAYEKGEVFSEGQIEHYLKKHFEDSKAKSLSFRPICAGAQNGAIIHYGTPDHNKKMVQGEMFLLDTGAFYEGGYATDLTRTFLIGGKNATAKKWQQEMFTLVLKASIKGLSARIKKGCTGQQLDSIVRQPLWQAGLDFAHGTGHGVGINVHEFPPRIAGRSDTILQEGQVFSIEPGLYVEGVGGVRIENLVCLVQDPKLSGFLRVLPLTFSPLDQKLIDTDMLDNFEKEFLAYFEAEYKSCNQMPQLPPLIDISFS